MSDKTLCELEKASLVRNDLKAYAKLVRKGKYVCRKCGRAARKRKYLCQPAKI